MHPPANSSKRHNKDRTEAHPSGKEPEPPPQTSVCGAIRQSPARSIVALVTGNQRSGVFLSYARTDGEAFAAILRERLRDEAPDIVVKQDRLLLEGGVGWWKQLTEAIDSVEFLVLVMTPSAMQSETVRKEWRYARQQGVCVYPVKAAPDSELHFSELPRWMSKAHFFDLDKEWESFVAHIRKGLRRPACPSWPPICQITSSSARRVRATEKSAAQRRPQEPVAITTALSGAGRLRKNHSRGSALSRRRHHPELR